MVTKQIQNKGESSMSSLVDTRLEYNNKLKLNFMVETYPLIQDCFC